MNILRLIDDGRFAAKTVAFASGAASSVSALQGLPKPAKPAVPRLRVIPKYGPSKTATLYRAAKTTLAAGFVEEIVFAVLAVCGMASVFVMLFQVFGK